MVILDGFNTRNIRYKENKTIENAEENDSDFHRPTYALHRNIKTPFPIQCVINVLDQRNAKQDYNLLWSIGHRRVANSIIHSGILLAFSLKSNLRLKCPSYETGHSAKSRRNL